MHLDNKQQRTTRTQHAGKLVHRHVRVCHVIQVVDAGNDIKGIVRKRHLLHTCLHVDHVVCICAEQPVLARKWVHAHALNRRLGPLETSPRTAAHVQKLFAVVEGGVNAEEICVDLHVVGVAHGSMFPLAHRLPVIHLAALLHWILLDCNTWLRNTRLCRLVLLHGLGRQVRGHVVRVLAWYSAKSEAKDEDDHRTHHQQCGARPAKTPPFPACLHCTR
mmetsp:Transcript_11075/g.33830  ORF Transcript_11075/g.33830 Transcript_11075/m.33830 type:complete len:219 (-) Transcript_11075:217-873(-)